MIYEWRIKLSMTIKIHSVNGKVDLSLCLTKHYAMKTCWDTGDIAPRILNVGTGWRWVVSLTLRPLYSREKNP